MLHNTEIIVRLSVATPLHYRIPSNYRNTMILHERSVRALITVGQKSIAESKRDLIVVLLIVKSIVLCSSFKPTTTKVMSDEVV